MPLYEYECQSCGIRFERQQRFTDEPVRECPECGASVRKVFHPAGIVFKGSGWYINDSRKQDVASTAPDSAKGGGETATPAAASTGESGSSAPAAKSESGAGSSKSESGSGSGASGSGAASPKAGAAAS